MKERGHLAEAVDETPIKPGESQEPPEFGPIAWLGPLQHRLGLFRIGEDVTPLHNEAQELHRRGVEHALLRIEKQTVLEEASQDPTDMLLMIMEGAGKHQDVRYTRYTLL